VTALSRIIADLVPDPCPDGEGVALRGLVPDDWLQGRTAYGGLSAALALHAAMLGEPDLPPLRSAQLAFAGPLSGELVLRARRLRRGRNAAFVLAEAEGAGGPAVSACFVFMGDTGSTLTYLPPPPDQPPPPPPDRPSPAPPPEPGAPTRPPFIGNFEFADAPRATGALDEGAAPGWSRWVRLRERDGLHPAVELMAVADCLPPAALALTDRAVPVGTVTWQVNLLAPAPVTRDGWWLLGSVADRAEAGWSSQDMTVRDAAGTLVARHTQGVAIFA